MYIRRKVFSKIEIDGEERLFSTNEMNSEKRMRLSDKVSIGIDKHLRRRGSREAIIAGFDGNTRDFHPMAARDAKKMAVIGAGVGALAGHAVKRGSGTVAGAAAGAALAGGSSYLGTRVGGKTANFLRDKNKNLDRKYQRMADRAKVANGDMTEEEFIEIYGK